jgi:Protein of unknown function (DUF2917)
MNPKALLPTRRLLNHREIMRIPHAAGAHVYCRRGSVWITQDGETQDLVLSPGDHVQLTQPGDALIFALEPASVLVERQAERLQSFPVNAARDPDWLQALAMRWLAPLQAFGRWA